MLNQIFVYGTLRNGEVNHHLLANAEFSGLHVTQPRYKMLHLGAYPGVIEGGSTSIVGEIYRIGKKQLKHIDRLEDYPRLYKRKLIFTPWGKARIYLYRGVRRNRKLVPSGDWTGKAKQSGPFSLY